MISSAAEERRRYPVALGRFYDVDELLNDPRNAKDHPRKSIEVIKESLKLYGQRKNIVVDASGKVRAGNGTLIAAKELGWKKLYGGPAPAKERDARGFALVDNRSAEFAKWNEERLGEEIRYLEGEEEYGLEMLGELGFASSEVEGYTRHELDGGDEVPEPPEAPVSRPGDLWVLGDHRLVCGDARDDGAWKLLLGSEKARMVWTDPPYNIDYVGKTKDALKIENDAFSPDEFREFLKETLGSTVRRTAPGGAVYVAAPSGDMFYEFAVVLGRDGLDVWRHTLAWVKNSLVMGRTDYHYRHESIFYGWVPGAGHYFTDDRTQDSVFEIDRPSASEEHPTMKPIELVARCVRNSSERGWLVVDPFGGSGTTLIACEQEGRKAALVELDPAYCDVIVERWQKVTGRKAQRAKRRAA